MVDEYATYGVKENRIYKLKDPGIFSLQNLLPKSDVNDQRIFGVMK